MAKRKKLIDKVGYHYYDNNPKNEKTGDCVVRAIALFMDETWETTYRELAEYGIQHGTMMNCVDCYGAFLAKMGYKKMPMPKRSDNTRYTAKEFAMELAEPGHKYILKLAHHLTVVGPDNRIWDCGDCGYLSVGNYWMK